MQVISLRVTYALPTAWEIEDGAALKYLIDAVALKTALVLRRWDLPRVKNSGQKTI
jgi:hypothetical protein